MKPFLVMLLSFSVTSVVFGLVITQCTNQSPAQSAATVSSLRETVCGYVELTAPSTPELDKALCRADAALKPIAAAYAGCPTTAETLPSATVIVREPWPDAGTIETDSGAH
jgi:hypothetical protein